MVLLFHGMSRGSPGSSVYGSAESHEDDDGVDLEAESDGEQESSGGALSESSGSAAPSAPPPVVESVVRPRGSTSADRIAVSSGRSSVERPGPTLVSRTSPDAAAERRREGSRMARMARVARVGSEAEREEVAAAIAAGQAHAREIAAAGMRPSRAGKTTMPTHPNPPSSVLRHRTLLARERLGSKIRSKRVSARSDIIETARGEGMEFELSSVAAGAADVAEPAIRAAAATAAEARAARKLRRGAPSQRRRAERAEAVAEVASHELRHASERRRTRVSGREDSERRDRLEEEDRRREEGPDDGPDEDEKDMPENEETKNVQDFFTYCKNWLDHERSSGTHHVKILPHGRKVNRMCLSSKDDAAKREKKLADMIGIGVLFVRHCGVLIPDEQDDNTDITDNLRADLRKYTTNKTLEELFATYRTGETGKLRLPQCAWMLNQFPSSSLVATERISRSETDLLLGYRRMITHAQCERLKLDLVEYGPSEGVLTSDVMADGECPFQESILAILHRSADAHNNAVLDSVKFTVADAVWLSLHMNDDDNAKDDPAFKRIMHAVTVHCKHQFEVHKSAKKKKHYQKQINACKTPGQLLRGSTSALEMSPSKYPYHLRPLFPQYEAAQVDTALCHAKETNARHELTAPRPRPYEAVLELWYEANCNLHQKGPFAETSGCAVSDEATVEAASIARPGDSEGTRACAQGPISGELVRAQRPSASTSLDADPAMRVLGVLFQARTFAVAGRDCEHREFPGACVGRA